MKKPHSSFSQALQRVRKARGITQEDFDLISSRTYISALERGIKQPTLPKVDEFAAHIKIHPLTLLTLSYLSKGGANDLAVLQARVSDEVLAILAAAPSK